MGEEVHNNVRDFRLERGLTQDDLAQAVGVSRQSINAIERGRYTPSLPLALRFAQFFRCSTDELFRLKEDDRHVR
ncbi:MAG TPA: helix-turn-helix transcriptional regulator [Anaerolineales bacterium]|nr:helix-turn-helix transcriptional regulator [Anaerolineales bacterium]